MLPWCEAGLHNAPLCAQVKGAVMLQGPPQTGKTSLLQLLQKRAEESHEFSRIIHLNMAQTDGDLHAALSLLKTSWEELFAVAPDGMPTQAQ